MKKVLSVLLCVMVFCAMRMTAFANENQNVGSKELEDGRTMEVIRCAATEEKDTVTVRLLDVDGNIITEGTLEVPVSKQMTPQDAGFPVDHGCLHNYVVTGDETITIRNNLTGEEVSMQRIVYTCTFCGDSYEEYY